MPTPAAAATPLMRKAPPTWKKQLPLPITWENAMQVFAIIDTDRSGWLSEQEFVNHYMANY